MDIHGLDFTVYPEVYPPSEDSYLLIDSVQFHPSDVVLDVGCGSGIISLIAAEKAERVVGIDISLIAVRNTQENIRRNNLDGTCVVIQSDLLSALSSGAKFSKIVFNPPYLPEDGEVTGLDHALVGGERGTELTEQFIRSAGEFLFDEGELYLVATSLSDVHHVRTVMEQLGFDVQVIAEKPLFYERLYVLRGAF